jgi:hypothetical protein
VKNGCCTPLMQPMDGNQVSAHCALFLSISEQLAPTGQTNYFATLVPFSLCSEFIYVPSFDKLLTQDERNKRNPFTKAAHAEFSSPPQ